MDAPSRSPPDSATLTVLVLRAQAGDERAFAQLFKTFRGRTLAYLRGLVEEDAEDVLQEVWLAIYRGLGSLAEPGAFRTWIYRVTRHRAIDQLRRRKRTSGLFVDEELAQDVADPRTEEQGSELWTDDFLRDLPALQREVVLLRYRDDLNYAEIASIVGCPVGTVRSRLFLAKQRLSAHARGTNSAPVAAARQENQQ